MVIVTCAGNGGSDEAGDAGVATEVVVAAVVWGAFLIGSVAGLGLVFGDTLLVEGAKIVLEVALSATEALG